MRAKFQVFAPNSYLKMRFTGKKKPRVRDLINYAGEDGAVCEPEDIVDKNGRVPRTCIELFTVLNDGMRKDNTIAKRRKLHNPYDIQTLWEKLEGQRQVKFQTPAQPSQLVPDGPHVVVCSKDEVAANNDDLDSYFDYMWGGSFVAKATSSWEGNRGCNSLPSATSSGNSKGGNSALPVLGPSEVMAKVLTLCDEHDFISDELQNDRENVVKFDDAKRDACLKNLSAVKDKELKHFPQRAST